MEIFRFGRKKTIADYREDDIYKSPKMLVSASKLLKILLESLRSLKPDEIVAHEGIFRTSISLLDNNNDLTAEESKQLVNSIPSLIPLLDKVTPITRWKLLELILHLKPESAREEFLSRLKKASNAQNVLIDSNELGILRVIIRYFNEFPDERAFESLKLCWSRMSNSSLNNASILDISKPLIDAFGSLAVVKNHTPSIDFLKKVSDKYGPERNQARAWIEEVKQKQESRLVSAMIQDNEDEVLEILKSRSIDANIKGRKGTTPLMQAAEAGTDLKYMKILIDHGADVNAKNDDDMTPLMFAVSNGLIEKMQLLISNGANVNAHNRWGQTPLTIACMGLEGYLDKDIIEFLVREGANTDVEDNYGNTPVSLASQKRGREQIIDEEIIKLLGKGRQGQ